MLPCVPQACLCMSGHSAGLPMHACAFDPKLGSGLECHLVRPKPSMCSLLLWYPWLQVPEECPASVEHIVAVCMARDPTQRPSARELYDALEAAQQ